MQEEKLVDVRYVAEKLGVNPRTVLRMVERKELPAVKVAHRLRFRPADLDAYLHVRPATAITPTSSSGARSSLSHPASMLGVWTDPEEDVSSQLSNAHLNDRSATHVRDSFQATSAQGPRRGKEASQLTIEQQRLQIAREKLELQEKLLELHREHVDHAFKMAHKAINLLPPETDPQIKSNLLQSLLPRLLPPDLDILPPSTTHKNS